MSADNWADCPRCTETIMAPVRAAYGKVSADEYVRLLAEARKRMDGSTFREDYEFYGAETGVLTISYRGVCTVCGLSLKVEEKREFWKP